MPAEDERDMDVDDGHDFDDDHSRGDDNTEKENGGKDKTPEVSATKPGPSVKISGATCEVQVTTSQTKKLA